MAPSLALAEAPWLLVTVRHFSYLLSKEHDMKVKDVMTGSCEFVAPDANLQEVAQRMRDLDCGFMPIGNDDSGRLEGVITDRDIVLRAVAEGLDTSECLAQDEIGRATSRARVQRHEEHVQRKSAGDE